MDADLRFRKWGAGAGFFDDDPLGRIAWRSQKHEFRIRSGSPKVFEIRASQAAAADEPIARSSRPAGFDRQRAHAVA